MATSLTALLVWICAFFPSLTSAEQMSSVKGESFTMLCYKDIPGVTGYFVELLYTGTGASSTTPDSIGKFDPFTGVARNIDSRYQNRLTFSPKYNITITNVRVEDEGKYACVLRGLYVEGDQRISNDLEVYVRPTVQVVLTNSPLQAGSELINAASCTALNGKPAATVMWSTVRHLQFNQSKSTAPGDEAKTTTSVSTLYVAPTKFYNQQMFLCRVEHPALKDGNNVSSVTLDVTYAPSKPHIEVINQNTQLRCTSEGNPVPDIQWTMPNDNPSPNTMTGSSTIRLISPEDPARQNDTYICSASNNIPPSTASNITTSEAVKYVAIVKQSNTGVIIGAVIGSVLILACIVALVYWFFIRKHREKDSGPYNAAKQERQESSWNNSSGRPTIQHANESLNKNAPPSPTRPPPDEEDDGSNYSQSDVEEFTEGHDVDINSPLTGPDDDEGSATGIVSKNSVNFQHRRQRPSTSPHRRSQNRNQPQPIPRTPQQSDPHYEVPPKEYYEDDYDGDERHLMEGQHHPMEDDRFYDRPEDRYPGYQRYDEPPHDDHLPPYTDTIQYASLDHTFDSGKPRTRPPYHEPVEYAEIRSKGQIV